MGMYERWTEGARKVLFLANQAAQMFNHEYISTAHLLLGLVRERVGVAATVLKKLGANEKELRMGVERLHESGSEVMIGKLKKTPRARKVIEYAIDEAKRLGHNYVGTEHILLGLTRESECTGAQVLTNLGINLDFVRYYVLARLGVTEARHWESVGPLTLLIDPADATAEELSELFVELSTLYRMVGGSGINFTIVDVREPAVA